MTYNYIIVDDEPLIRKGTKKKINKLDLPIKCIAEASNGKDALDLCNNEQVDFVITDMDMPKMDGVQFIDYLKSTWPNIPIIVISAYQNFSYLQKALQAQAVNYLLKPFGTEEIYQSLIKVIDILDNNIQSKINQEELILNLILGNKTTAGINAATNIITQTSHYKLVLATLNDENDVEFKQIAENYPFSTQLDLNFNLFVTIVPQTDVQKFIEDTLSLSLSQGISSPITAAKNLHQHFLEATHALNNRNIGSDKVQFFQEEPVNFQIDYTPEEERIMYYIESGKVPLLKENLFTYFNYLYKTEKVSIYKLKLIGLNLIKNSKKSLDSIYSTDSNYTLPTIESELLTRIFEYDDIYKYFDTFLENIAIGMSYEKIYDSTDIIDNVQTYIDNHYEKPITLDFLADIFYLNNSYLSTLFKDKTGVKYVDYLNQVRISAAKKLLNSTDKPLTQIAHDVGYENEKYFFRIFKKNVGQTPNEYRKIQTLNNIDK